jgi:hypothetical protein
VKEYVILRGDEGREDKGMRRKSKGKGKGIRKVTLVEDGEGRGVR